MRGFIIMLLGILTILAFVLAIVVTVLAFIFIVPDKKRDKLNKFWKFIHDTANFKYLIVEKILQALYIFATAYVFLQGFLMLFYVTPGYGYGGPEWHGGRGILIMIFGPIVVRLMYEFIMMAILLVKNVIQINNKLKASDDSARHDIFATPKVNEIIPTAKKATPVVEEAPVEVKPTEENTAGTFCPNCGARVTDDSAFCTFCGTKIN